MSLKLNDTKKSRKSKSLLTAIILELDHYERGVVINALNDFRNDMIGKDLTRSEERRCRERV